ncbi:MAG: hypothetical protein JSW49_07740 [candidate division WOR-3 bacterium]|nr:MAG: hypothetical protein JSW49_07740 [candidate division WOR-3 bacterium]
MRKWLGLLGLCVLLAVFCGAPEEGPGVKTEKPSEKTGAEMYYATLGESELQRFIKAVPVFKAAVEKIESEFESTEGPQEFASMLGQYSVLNKRVPELEANLKAAGMVWEEFWPAMGKTYMAIGAVVMDSMITSMKTQMQGAQPEMVEQVMKGMEEASEIYEEVPQVNRDLVRKYWAELASVLEFQ